MEFKRFIIPSSFYPRYFYFHQRLRRFVPKFQDIVGKNVFSKCILFGEQHIEDILKAYDQFNEQVEVFVGKDDAIKEEVTWKELIVEDNSMDDGAVRESDTSRPSGASCGSQICLVLVNNTTIEKWKNIFCGEKGLIFFNTDDSRNTTEKPQLNKLVQAELETRVISLFESVYSFINKLIPRGCKEFSDLTQHTCSIDKSKAVKEAIHELVREHAKKDPEKQDKTAFICAIKTVVIKRTRATFCEDLSKACCLPQSVILDFQGDNFFDVEKKIMEIKVNNEKDITSSDETTLMRMGMELFSCIVQCLQDIEQKFVKFMKEQIVSISMLSRKQFELTGFLRTTNVQIDVLLPTILKIPRELQHKLLQNHPDVSGCGHRHGKFVIDVKKALAEEEKKEIRREMKEYSFNFDFESEVIKYVKQAGFCVEQGNIIRVKNTKVDHQLPYKTGRLGCLMQKEEMGSQGPLFGITCGHCVSGCDESVDVCIDHENDFKPLGKVHYNSAQNGHENDFLDIAAIEITNEMSVKTELKRSDGRDAKTWDVFDENIPQGRDVYMITCQMKNDGRVSSRISIGTIISSEFLEDNVKKNFTPLEASCETVHKLPGPYFVHIAPEEFSVGPFSVEGDSGAVICADDMDSVKNVHVIALLTGAVKKISTDGLLQYIHSKGSVMHKLLSVVKKQAHMQLLPACAKPNAGGSEAAPATLTTTTPSVDRSIN